MKTFLTQTLSLIVCILAAAAVRWVVDWNLGPFPLILDVAGAAAVFAFCWLCRSSTVPLLLCIEVGTALSWLCLYAYWFSAWAFHSVLAVRVCEAVGSILLLPAKWVFEFMGGDQSTAFSDPISYFATNGLIVGILIYSAYRSVSNRREAPASAASAREEAPRAEAKAQV